MGGNLCAGLLLLASLAQLARATDFKIGASVWKHAEWRRLYAGTPLEPSLLTTKLVEVKTSKDWAISRQPKHGEPSETIRRPP